MTKKIGTKTGTRIEIATNTKTQRKDAHRHYSNIAIEMPTWEVWNNLHRLMKEAGFWTPRQDKEISNEHDAVNNADHMVSDSPGINKEDSIYVALHEALEGQVRRAQMELGIQRELLAACIDRFNPELFEPSNGITPGGIESECKERLEIQYGWKPATAEEKKLIRGEVARIEAHVRDHLFPWGVCSRSEEEYHYCLANKFGDGSAEDMLRREGPMSRSLRLYEELMDALGEAGARDTAAGLAAFLAEEFKRIRNYKGKRQPQGLRSTSGVQKLINCTDDLAKRVFELYRSLPASPAEDYSDFSITQAQKVDRGKYPNVPDVIVTYDPKTQRYCGELFSEWRKMLDSFDLRALDERFKQCERMINNRAFLNRLDINAVLEEWTEGAQQVLHLETSDKKKSEKAATPSSVTPLDITVAGQALLRDQSDQLGQQAKKLLRLYEETPTSKKQKGTRTVTRFEAGMRLAIGMYDGFKRSLASKPDLAAALANLQARYLESRDDFDLARVTVEDVMYEAGAEMLEKRAAERYLKGLVLRVEGVGTFRAKELLTSSGFSNDNRCWWNRDRLSGYQIMGYICEIINESQGAVTVKNIKEVRHRLIQDYLLGQYDPHAKSKLEQFKGISYKAVQNYLNFLATFYPERVGLNNDIVEVD